MTQVANLVHQTTIGTGTGDMILSVLTGRRTFFSAFGSDESSKFFYFINHRERAEWEAGIGYLLANNQLKRETVIKSSNSDGLVNFSSGLKDVVNDIEASRQLVLPSGLTAGDLLLHDGTNFIKLARGTNGQVLYVNGSSVVWSSAISDSLSSLETSLNDSVNNLNEIIYDLENSVEQSILNLSEQIYDLENQLATSSDIGITGLMLSVNATDSDHDIDISAGKANADDLTSTITLSSTLVKQIDASWAAGSNQGGLDTGSVTTNTWYHVWLIKRSDTGEVDALFSTSATSPTMPASYDLKRRIGAVKTNGLSNIWTFRQYGDKFIWDLPKFDVNTSVATIRTNYTLSVPSGIAVTPIFHISVTTATGTPYLLITNPDMTNTVPSTSIYSMIAYEEAGAGTAVPPLQAYCESFLTNTSSQISIRATNSTSIRIQTIGWIDPRGKW